VGQPVIIPGDMGRYSYVLAGTERARADTYGSSCHGAGRRLSRSAAKRSSTARDVMDDLAGRGVVLKAAGMGKVTEEMPQAYKDVAEVRRGHGRRGNLDAGGPVAAARRHKRVIIEPI
jgi:tRNA-splicing ligase RtcB (3'-phosphate/5'-hydroxy nucleic acid ligase)